MPRFSVRWLEIAIEYYDARRTTTYGDGAGLIRYAVVREQRRVLMLRLV
jgi:hypothetical protein